MALIEIISECSQDAIYENNDNKKSYLGSKYIIRNNSKSFLLNTSEIQRVFRNNEYDWYNKKDNDEVGLFLVLIMPKKDHTMYCRHFKTEEERDEYYNTLIDK